MAAAKGQLGTVYKITKQLSGRRNICNKLVKDKQGRLLTTERGQAVRWAQHFEEVLNQPEPEEPVAPEPLDNIDVNTNPPSQAEAEAAIKEMKKGKAPGIDLLQAELKLKILHLEAKLGSFQAQKLNYDKMAGYIKLQAQQTEKTIKEEFVKLYQFLRAEEAARIDAVRKEATLKSEAVNIRIVNLTAEISSLEDRIRTTEREMMAEDISFMLDQLQLKILHLKTKLGSFKAQKLTCDKMAGHIKLQAQQTEKTIKEEFLKLYQFLRAEEAARIDAVRKEATLKSEVVNIRIVNLTAEISSLEDRIRTTKREMMAEDISFMLNVRSTMKRVVRSSHSNNKLGLNGAGGCTTVVALAYVTMEIKATAGLNTAHTATLLKDQCPRGAVQASEGGETKLYDFTLDPETTADQSSDQTNTGHDIWAEVRMLRDMVVEQKVELRKMETRLREAEVQAGEQKMDLLLTKTSLEDLKRDHAATEDRLRASEKQVEELKRVNMELRADLQSQAGELLSIEVRVTVCDSELQLLTRRMDDLQAQSTAQEAELTSVMDRMNTTESRVDSLIKENAKCISHNYNNCSNCGADFDIKYNTIMSNSMIVKSKGDRK
ncbi:hypothetical protein ABVT39_011038 [Epinephelus coioides]